MNRRWFLLFANVSFPITIQRSKNHHELARYHSQHGDILTLSLKGEMANLTPHEDDEIGKLADAVRKLRPTP